MAEGNPGWQRASGKVGVLPSIPPPRSFLPKVGASQSLAQDGVWQLSPPARRAGCMASIGGRWTWQCCQSGQARSEAGRQAWLSAWQRSRQGQGRPPGKVP